MNASLCIYITIYLNIFGFAKKKWQGLLERGVKYVIVQGLPLTRCLPLATTLARADDRDAWAARPP
jgi:hypothetical protein